MVYKHHLIPKMPHTVHAERSMLILTFPAGQPSHSVPAAFGAWPAGHPVTWVGAWQAVFAMDSKIWLKM